MSEYVTKKIALPGGRVIDIVYFADGGELPEPEPVAPAPGDVRPSRDVLHICTECGSDLVYPVAWEERPGEKWQVVRRCPECEWRGEGEFHQVDIEIFDDVLNEGTDDLLGSLRGLARTNMQEDVDALIDAINNDCILPEDF